MSNWSGFYKPLVFLTRKLLQVVVRIRVLPEDIDELELQANKPVCYVLDLRGIANPLVVDIVCERLKLPRPIEPLAGSDGQLPAIAYLRKMRGLVVRRMDPRSPPDLANLYDYVLAHRDEDVQLVPVSVFFGRSPEKEVSSFKILFSDSWSIAGRLRKLLTILIHGRQTLVQFSRPVSMQQFVDEGLEHGRALRKLSRVLRVHFRRWRVAAIGPDLSHRRTMVDELLASDAVREEIENQARANNWPVEKARGKARKYANEIAADYSYPVIRFFDRFLSWLWNKLFRGIELNHFDLLKDATPGNEIVYVPCHRSHVDYLLLSYLLYHNGLAPPHIAAGVNLNLPLVGPLLRRGGAFFLRRSFKGNRLYAKVFDAYLSRNISRGVALEYFIEGGRSRTGRLLNPKSGLLAMTVQSYLRDQKRPVVFIPIYIGYERLIEGRAYLSELGGKPKRSESLAGIFRSIGILRKDFGKVHVNIGQPLPLTGILDECAPDWREYNYADDKKPEFIKTAVAKLGRDILLRINAATAVTPINLLALALLATRRQAMSEADLERQIELYLTLFRKAPYSELVTTPELSGREVVAYGEQLGVVSRREHWAGDILLLEGDEAVLMTYFRNNVLHLVSLPSMVACCFVDNRVMDQASVVRLCAIAKPFVESEFSLSVENSDFERRIVEVIDLLVDLKLLLRANEGQRLRRPPSSSFEAVQLSVLARSVLQTLERYYLVIALLLKHGSGTTQQGQLERECQGIAERMSMLHDIDAPEFFDRRLFRGFIDELRSRNVVWPDERQRLAYDSRIKDVERDARIVLSDDIRNSILQMTHA